MFSTTTILLTILIKCVALFRGSNAISANPNPIIQNGLPPYYIRGDEHYHWFEDENGYTIIDELDDRLPNTTRKIYAKVDETNGNLISSGIRFGVLSSSSLEMTGLKKHAKPSTKVRKTVCGDFCDDLFSVSGMNKDGTTRRRRMQQQQQTERANRRQLASSEGSLRNLVVLVRFADHVNRILPSPHEFDILINGPDSGSTSSITPTGSVNDVFLANSYGKFSLHSTVYPWITLSQSEAYYGDNKSGIGSKLHEAIREALDYIDLDPTFDISEFNTDYDQGDLYIDAITIIHSGYGAEFGGSDCYGTTEDNRIWSHSWFMYESWTSRDGKVRVSDYHINPGLWGTCGSEISRIGVIAHETFHFLGLPDLYDPSGGYGIGDFCLMSNSWGVDGSQRYPPILSAWSKIELGWVDPVSIGAKGDYTIRQSYEFPDVYKIDVGYAPNEYLLIENRQPGSFDSLLQLGGLAIWHIDENISQHGNEGYPGQLGWPSNNKHYAVALLQADGRYDLERGVNYGDFGDLFRSDYFFGVDHLFPSIEHPILGPFPNTDSYSQGVVARTNNFISGISTIGPEMTFSLLPSSPCQPNEVHFDLTLLVDGKGNEVSWTLTETYTDELALSGDIYASYNQYNVEECLPARCYTFTINDTGNDGLCCDYGYGGYSVRLNGLKLASGNQFASQDKTDLECISVPPTKKPTVAPSKPPTPKPTTAPTSSPSASPSFEPSAAPTGICGRHDGTLEITLEGGLFVEGISWEVKNTFDEVLVYENVDNNEGLYTTELCVPLDACYTFTIHNSMAKEHEENRLLYSVKLDGKMIANGRDFGASQSTIFGNNCLRNGDISCAETEQNDDPTIPMSMFRLEIASAERELSWKLVDDSNRIIISDGPFHECNINQNAVCLPREACYELIVVDEDGCCSFGNDKFTVLFTQTDNLIQNYTGSVLGDIASVFLGTCYDRNFE